MEVKIPESVSPCEKINIWLRFSEAKIALRGLRSLEKWFSPIFSLWSVGNHKDFIHLRWGINLLFNTIAKRLGKEKVILTLRSAELVRAWCSLCQSQQVWSLHGPFTLRVGLCDPCGFLPTYNILWFCEYVPLCLKV